MFCETSASENKNVSNAFEELVKKILEDNILDDANGVMKSDIRLRGMNEDSGQDQGRSSCGFGLCGR
jgi:hypothetical protein